MDLLFIADAVGKKPSIDNKRAKEAGFSDFALDLNSYISGYEIEYKEKSYKEFVKRGYDKEGEIFLPNEPERLDEATSTYLNQCNQLGVETKLLIAPTLPNDTKRNDVYDLVIKLTKETIKLAKITKSKFIVIPSLIKDETIEKFREKTIEFYLELLNDTDVMILIPNSPRLVNGHLNRGIFSDGYKLSELIDELNSKAGREAFGVYFDTGVTNALGQKGYEICEILGSRIKAVRLTENDGLKQSRLLPYTEGVDRQDRMDWLSLIRGIRKTGFDGPVVLDFADLRATVPHILHPHLFGYAKAIGDFFIWQFMVEHTLRKYKQRVLFGAGNMCRNYMKCYGEEFKPLYTCDNNSAIWGQYFEGLEIKNPSELKKLPSDCAIFICNLYYDEIEKQLRDMGITNPIEKFNDEYMPSLYLDRFDSDRREVR